MAHFLILWSIYICLNEKKETRLGFVLPWVTVILLSIAIHFYLSVIVILFWLCHLLSRTIVNKKISINEISEFIIILSSCSIELFTLGYFTIDNVSVDGGYGTYNSNILSPLIASGWSRIITSNFFGSTGLEGMNYWGLGVILLFIITITWQIKTIRSGINPVRLITFILSVLAFFSISTTNIIALGSHSLVIPLPYKVEDMLSIVRASSRFYWPLTYLCIIFCVYVVINNLSKKKAIIFLSLITLIQAYDISKGFEKENFYFKKQHFMKKN